MRLIKALLVALALASSSLAIAPAAQADGCGGGRAPFTTWRVCDYDWQPDGWHMHCDSVYVFGFGGWNCFPVFPPPPVPL